MTKVRIPFNEWSKRRLDIQRKNATSRPRKYGNVGDLFNVDDVEYEIDLVVKLPLWFITTELFMTEGADAPQEFIDAWKLVHPIKGYDPDQLVWYHHFKES